MYCTASGKNYAGSQWLMETMTHRMFRVVESKSIMGTFSEPVAQHNISIALRTARQPNPIIISTK